MNAPRKTRLAIVSTHPIQYNVPVFQALAADKRLELRVLYGWCGASQIADPGFGQPIQWDIPLLEGYDFELVPNVAPDPGSHHFRGIKVAALDATCKLGKNELRRMGQRSKAIIDGWTIPLQAQAIADAVVTHCKLH